MTGKGYYVSARDPENEKRSWLVVGPFREHAEALVLVKRVRVWASERQPLSHFYAWGTASVTKDSGELPEGSFNKHLTVGDLWPD